VRRLRPGLERAREEFDSTPPQVVAAGVIPADAAINVPTDSQWSSRSPRRCRPRTVLIHLRATVSNVVITWDSVNRNASVGHAPFDPNLAVHDDGRRRGEDACTPGNQMTARFRDIIHDRKRLQRYRRLRRTLRSPSVAYNKVGPHLDRHDAIHRRIRADGDSFTTSTVRIR